MSSLRSLKRKAQDNKGQLVHKKVVARKMGCTVKDYNKRMAKRKKNMQEDN